MALVAVDAVVDVARHLIVLEIVGVIAAMAAGALEDRVVVRVRVARRTHAARIAVVRGELCVLRVIEGSASPRGGVVAGLARCGEELRLCRVARIRRVVVVGLVAPDARRRQRGVVVVHVAIGAHARRHRMRTGQGEGSVVVVEGRVGPDGRVVADLARRGEARSCMRWVRGVGVILLVARIAERAVQGVVIVDVAIGAKPRRHGMRARQLEPRAGVVERGIGPLNRVVTRLARCGEARGDVIHRRQSVVVVRLMARDTGRAGQVVVVVHVTVGALPRRDRMRTRQREARAVVIESRIQPRSRAVALIAGLREIRRDVIRVRRPLKVLQMAADAGARREVVVVVDVAIGAQPRRHRVHAG